MAREGTRSQTGNSRPRVFHTIDTGPTITRKKRTNTTTTSKPKTKVAATKKKTAAGTESTTDKVKAALSASSAKKEDGKKPRGVTKSSASGSGSVKKAVQKVKAQTQRPAETKA